MSAHSNQASRDNELLSAYIDGMLEDTEHTALEERLNNDPFLRDELAALRQTIALIHQLPQRKAPRNFTLTQAMVAAPLPAAPKSPITLPVQHHRIIPLTTLFRVASAAASMLLILSGLLLLFSEDSHDATPMQAAQEMLEAEVSLYSNTIPVDTTSTPQIQVEETSLGASSPSQTATAAHDETTSEYDTAVQEPPSAFMMGTPAPDTVSDGMATRTQKAADAIEAYLEQQALDDRGDMRDGAGGGDALPNDIGQGNREVISGAPPPVFEMPVTVPEIFNNDPNETSLGLLLMNSPAPMPLTPTPAPTSIALDTEAVSSAEEAAPARVPLATVTDSGEATSSTSIAEAPARRTLPGITLIVLGSILLLITAGFWFKQRPYKQ